MLKNFPSSKEKIKPAMEWNCISHSLQRQTYKVVISILEMRKLRLLRSHSC
jgi:hypothetical protein